MARRSPVAVQVRRSGELPVTGALTGDDLKIALTLPIQGQSIDIVMTGKVERRDARRQGAVRRLRRRRLDRDPRARRRPRLRPQPRSHDIRSGGEAGSGLPTAQRRRQWDFTFKTPNGDLQAVATVRTRRVARWSGTLSSALGEAPFTGTLEGTSLRVHVQRHHAARARLPITMKGNIEGDTICERQGEDKGHGHDEMDGQEKTAVMK